MTDHSRAVEQRGASDESGAARGASGPVDSSSSSEMQTLSDAALQRLLRGMLVTLAGIVVVVLVVAGVRWMLTDDTPEPYSAVDIGFLQDMIDHHEQALEIADALLVANPHGVAGHFARDVQLYQGREIERMDAWLADAGATRGAPDRQTMAWMGMPTPLLSMPGMQDPARIAELAASSGDAADLLFFELMTAHHLGGVHMAEFAGARGERTDVSTFATNMARGQQIEVVEYRQAVERAGLSD